MKLESVTDWIGAAGALGTAAFGMVEALKWTPIGLIGIGKVRKGLGRPAIESLKSVYGSEGFDALLRGTYRKGPGELEQLLRDGLRLALKADNAQTLARAFGQDGNQLRDALARFAAQRAQAPAGAAPAPGVDALEDRTMVGRFELAVDARIQAALANAQDFYAGMMRLIAGLMALAASLLVAFLGATDTESPAWGQAFLVGVAAVPIAPITKDLISLLSAATSAVGFKRRDS
jgi:hypothetical protein